MTGGTLSPRRRRASTALLVVGYPVACAAGAKLLPVLCERRARRFLVLEAGAACITTGLVLRRRPLLAAVNGTFLAGVAAAWVLTGRNR